ncbi:MAG TPA: ATP-binding protein [Anaeromyxobacteraceae bacterium]|jgi:SpoVK/Ycf46/Vps4 family AAA+-type ATPase|nr:ATP-binding protein [Anaeromyxobacteraceae bacterium]
MAGHSPLNFLVRRRGRERRRGGEDQELFEGALVAYARNLLVGGNLVDRLQRGTGRSPEEYPLLGRAVSARRPRGALTEQQFRARLQGLRRHARGELEEVPAPAEPAAANLALIAAVLGLTPDEREVLQFVAAQRLSPDLEDVTDAYPALSRMGCVELVSAATGLARGEVSAALAPRGRLLSSGIVRFDEEFGHLEHKLVLDARVLELVITPELDRDRLLAAFLPLAPPPSLGLEDFAHLSAELEVARRLLRAALAQRRPGVNLLFHGPTGTGKTELARLLAREAGAQVHVAGLQDPSGQSPSSQERLASLLLGNRVLAASGAVLLFDELEDLLEPATIFSGERTLRASKQWMTQLLEQNPVPCVWATNDASFDPAFLRRFTYAIEFRPLGALQRERVWRRHLGAGALPEAEVARLAARYAVSPAEIGSAVAAARLVAPDERPDRATLEAVLAPMVGLVGGRGADGQAFDPVSYRVEAACTSTDLAGLADRLAGWRPGDGPGVSLCLYGPSGTGKSEFVHYLAHRMGRQVVARRVSDIESKWVGDSERNLAAAFREAAASDAVLLFDEADSFLRDRRGAVHQWEASLVNEFLQQLERHPGVVACTTNLYRDLDEAALRRFAFKVKFEWLREEQALLLFRERLAPLLGRPLAPEEEAQVAAELRRLPRLAPGDFAAASRRLRVLGGASETEALVAELAAEAAARGDAPKTIGF